MMVTAVIPHWNRRDLLPGVIADLRAQTHPVREIVVVDNGSTDGSQKAARQEGARVVEMGRNAGFAAAVNRGVQEAATPWIAILNNDVRLNPQWLERLAPHDSHWFLTGKIFRAGAPGVLDGAFDLLSRGACAWRAGNGKPDGSEWSQARQIQFVPFTAALFRRELFDRVGPLDEQFGSYLEDVDFGLRCALEGLQGWYQPEAIAFHIGSATFGRWDPRTVRLLARNQMLLIARHYPRDWKLRYGWPVLVGQLLWGALAARHGAGGAWLAGKREGLALLRAQPPGREEHPSLAAVLAGCEQDIQTLQKQTGYDLFWRLYFALT